MKKFIAMMMVAAAVFAACEKENKEEGPVEEGPVEEPNTVKIGDVTYKTITLENGLTWMAEPLRYVPAGKTVSDNPKEGQGIWYPYTVVDGVPTAQKDEATIAKQGYLYDAATAFGVDAITTENFGTFEGIQGICPEGWHIPTRTDFIITFGYSNKAEGETDAFIDNTATFYDETHNGGSVVKANEKGFNFSFAGSVISGAYNKMVVDEKVSDVTEFIGRNRMNYIIGSTPYKMTTNDDGSIKQAQYFHLMSTFTTAYPKGRLTAAYGAYNTAGEVRCVKNI